LSSDPEQEYFAQGLSEDLITDLSRVPGLVVIARNSSFAYGGRPTDVRQIGRELGVRYVIEGSVRRSSGRVRINAEIIDALEHTQIWADRFDRDLSDIFALQDEIVGEIVGALSSKLPASVRPTMRRTGNLEAYDLFTRGRWLATQSPEDNRESQPLLERSIELDPDFAEAHAWLAVSLAFGWLYWGEPKSHYTRGVAAARQAVALDPDNSTAHSILGCLIIYSEGHVSEAEAELTTALRINPNDADALTFLAELRVSQGRSVEAIDSVRAALGLNPFPPGRSFWYLGYAQYAAGRYEDAVQTLSMRATHRTGSQRILAAALAQLGRMEEARTEARQFLSTNPHFRVRHWAETQYFEREADRQVFVEGYLKAGLPL
jgi:TolB-like protein/Tfp pilus assembly protein PilF